jgi:hypothetical protein
MGAVYTSLLETRARRGGGFFLLLDPDSLAERDCLALAELPKNVGLALSLCEPRLLSWATISRMIPGTLSFARSPRPHTRRS